MTADVVLFAEADGSIGTGHLVEAIHVAEAAATAGLRPVLVAPASAPEPLLRTASCEVERIDSISPDHLRRCARQMRASGVRVALTDFRLVSDAQLAVLAGEGLSTYCIDEFGSRALDCSAVFNPTIVEDRHRYDESGAGPRVFAGPAYFPLAPDYADCHARHRSVDGRVRSVIVSMGGVDRSGATLRIFDALDAWVSDAERHLVLGGAFAWDGEIERRLSKPSASWRVHRNVPGLARLFAEADVAVTAGGNTIYELACVGTPAIVAHEDPHEAAQGKAFERRGFGVSIGSGTDFDSSALLNALERLNDPGIRRAQSLAGRSIVDGLGAERICSIVRQDVERDSTVQA